jgi:hypothetical protein
LDSKLAADPIARGILEKLTLLERTAGVRAHYRILDPPPLQSTDIAALQTAARMIGDWIGLRNTIFHILPSSNSPSEGTLIRSDGSADEFTMELPEGSTKTIASALSALCYGVAKAYLAKANIGHTHGTSQHVSTPAFVDVTAVFLGFGKLLLNCSSPPSHPHGILADDADQQPDPEKRLATKYVAFTHRVVCAMRGLDYEHHLTGLTADGIAVLRSWDTHRDTLLTQSLRNVLTASAPHRPLMDALSDNRIGLARMDQMVRFLEAAVLQPVRQELAGYHQECRDAAERATSKEPETYDPCLVYLNHARRRMDMQKLADDLATQQETVIKRFQVLLRALNSLDEQGLVVAESSRNGSFPRAQCPFDGAPLNLSSGEGDVKAICPSCGYEMLASSAAPPFVARQISAHAAQADETHDSVSPAKSSRMKAVRPQKARSPVTAAALRSRAAALIGASIGAATLSWLPLLGYAMFAMWKDVPLVHGEILGRIGLAGTWLGAILFAAGLLHAVASLLRRTTPPNDPVRAAAGSHSA